MSYIKSAAFGFVATTALLMTACVHHGPGNAQSGAANAIKLVTYHCKGGATIKASYPANNVAVVQYQGQTKEMHIARSADGARYKSDDWVWWTKGTGRGSTATFYDLNAYNNASGQVIERCTQANGASPSQPPSTRQNT